MKPTVGTRKPYSGQSRSLVLALDVGTTFSGVSYAILEPGEVPKIHGVTRYPGQEHVAGNSKIPSIMYYDINGHMKAAGAEADGAAVLAQAEDEGWIKIELFKLRLRPKTMTLQMNGMRLSPLPRNKEAVDVFGDFLSYLFRCTQSFIVDTHANGHALWRAVEDEIQFVLSHPNGWEGAQQTKMRRAAVLGGLISDTDEGRARIRFVTEGEASLHACVLNGLAADVLSNPSGHGFLVADAGGGTLDISSYAIRGTHPLVIEEIAPPDCVFAGSVFVSRRARGFFEEKLKKSKYGSSDSLDHITKRFDETTKRLFRDSKELQFVPFGSPLDKDLSVGIRGGQLKLTGMEVAALFEPSIQAAMESIKSQIKASSGQVKSVWLVGGFAASPWLFTQLQERLSPMGVTVSRPDSQTSKAVADGAIGFYCDHHVSARVSKFMYGVEFLRTFDPNDDDHVSRKHRLFELPSGPKLLPDAFDCILARGVKVKESTVFSRKYCTEVTNLTTLSVFEVEIWCYRGGDTVPKWIHRNADNFSTLCYVRADLSQLAGIATSKEGKGGKQYWTIIFSIEIHFGLTEFRARIKWNDKNTIRYGPASIVYNESGKKADEDEFGDLPDDDVAVSSTPSRSSHHRSSTSSRAPSRTVSRSASVTNSTQPPHIDLPPVHEMSAETRARMSESRARTSASSRSSSSRSPELDRRTSSHTSRGADIYASHDSSRRASTIYDKGRESHRSSMAPPETPRAPTTLDRSVNLSGRSTDSRISSRSGATARLGETLSSIWGTPSAMSSHAPSKQQTPIASPRGEASSYFESMPGQFDHGPARGASVATTRPASPPAPSKPPTPPSASKYATPSTASGAATPRGIPMESIAQPPIEAPPTATPRAASPRASKAPSPQPSRAPTAASSRSGTVPSSKAPSVAPSKAPSVAPSVAPSKAPSVAPSVAPSKAPSVAPSAAQSKAPSVAASRAPTAAPSKAATPAATPKATLTGATTPKASAWGSKAATPVATPAATLTPPAATVPPSKVSTPAVSKAASRAPTRAPSKAPSANPSPKHEPEAIPEVLATVPEVPPAASPAPPPPAPVQRSDDDAVIPPKPEDYQEPPLSGLGISGLDNGTPADHGLGDLWGADNKDNGPGFGDFLTSGNNWTNSSSATPNPAESTAPGWGAPAAPAWGAFGNNLGSSIGAWGKGKAAEAANAAAGWNMPAVSMPAVSLPNVTLPAISMPSIPAVSMPKLPADLGSNFGGALTNAFGLGTPSEGGEKEDPMSATTPAIPGGFAFSNAPSEKNEGMHVEIPLTNMSKEPAPETPSTPNGMSKTQQKKRLNAAAKKAEEDAAAAAEAEKRAEEERAAAAAKAEEDAKAAAAEAEAEEAKKAAEAAAAAAPGTPAAPEAPAPPAESTEPEATPATEGAPAEASTETPAEAPPPEGAADAEKKDGAENAEGGEEGEGSGDAADEKKDEEEDDPWFNQPKKGKKGGKANANAPDMSRTASGAGAANGPAKKKGKGKGKK